VSRLGLDEANRATDTTDWLPAQNYIKTRLHWGLGAKHSGPWKL